MSSFKNSLLQLFFFIVLGLQIGQIAPNPVDPVPTTTTTTTVVPPSPREVASSVIEEIVSQHSIPTTTPKYCDKHTVDSVPSTMQTDLLPCYCVEGCTTIRFDQMIRGSCSAKCAPGTYTLFSCVQSCFKNAAQPLTTILNQWIVPMVPTRVDYDRTNLTEIQARDSIKETEFVSFFLSMPYHDLYKPLLEKLNQVIQADKQVWDAQVAKRNGVKSQYVFENVDFSALCFRYAVKPRKGVGLKMVLGQTYACRLYVRCFLELLRKLVASVNSNQPTTEAYWGHYVCAQAAYGESSTLIDSIILPVASSSTQQTTTSSPPPPASTP